MASPPDVTARLEEVRDVVHKQYDSPDGLHRSRMAQFDAALATLTMVIEHLHDEDVRHRVNPKAHQKAIGAYMREED
jgi:hypothetical protein